MNEQQTEVRSTQDNKPGFFSKDAIKLALFAFFTTSLCVITFLNTRARIEENKINAIIASLNEVSPGAKTEPNLVDQWVHISPPNLGLKKISKAYVVKPNSMNSNWVLPLVAPDGYGGAIELLMGLDQNGAITGVRVIPPHAETPGLGDKIEIKKSNWIETFNGKSLENTSPEDWAIKKEGGAFDAFTGASITPRAVINAIHKGLIYFNTHQNKLENIKLQSEFSHKKM